MCYSISCNEPELIFYLRIANKGIFFFLLLKSLKAVIFLVNTRTSNTVSNVVSLAVFESLARAVCSFCIYVSKDFFVGEWEYVIRRFYSKKVYY